MVSLHRSDRAAARTAPGGMSLELLSTLSSMATALIIAATAIAALVQLRHLRAGNLITALLTIENEMDNQEFRDAERLVREELPQMLVDRDFCRYVFALDRHEKITQSDDRYVSVRQAAVLIANTFENLGALVKRGLFDKNLFLDIYCSVVVGFWTDLSGFTALRRAAAREPRIYENFEYIAVISRRNLATQGSEFPPGIERFAVSLPEGAADLV